MTPPLVPILDGLKGRPSRTWSIVITVFGDAVVPRGGALWLGTLLDLFAGMEIAGGVVRTAMSRLAADGWLQRSRVGRNSFYRLTDKGRTSFAAAAQRIYGAPPERWDGKFRLLVPGNGPDRDAARLALEGAGFGSAAAGLWIAPMQRPVPDEAASLLSFVGCADGETGRRLADRAWRLAETAAGYERFLETFAPLCRAVAAGSEIGDLDALVARTLLIHEYRRVVLRDPRLPPALLPAQWPGTQARQVCAQVYAALLPGSERWLDRHGRDENGPLPKPATDLKERFARAPAHSA